VRPGEEEQAEAEEYVTNSMFYYYIQGERTASQSLNLLQPLVEKRSCLLSHILTL